MSETIFIPTQRATQPLEHGRIVWEIDNSKVIRFIEKSYDPVASSDQTPEIEFVGEGIATYEIKMMFQPTPKKFPCLVGNARFTLNVFWDNENKHYLATPVDIREMNQSSQWLYEGVQTMNALYTYWKGCNFASNERNSDLEQSSSLSQSRIAEFIGTILGTAGRYFLS